MGNDDVASVNARREYMGNVTVSVYQKWVHGIHTKGVGCFPVSDTSSSSLPHECLAYRSRRAAVLKAGEKL